MSRMQGLLRPRAVGDAALGRVRSGCTNRAQSREHMRGGLAGCRHRRAVHAVGDCRRGHRALRRLHRRRVERKHGDDRDCGRHQDERCSARRDPSMVSETSLLAAALRAPTRGGLGSLHVVIGWCRRLACVYRR